MKNLLIFLFAIIFLTSCEVNRLGNSPRTTGQVPNCGNHPIIGTWTNVQDTITFNVSRSESKVTGTWFKEGDLTAISNDKIIDIYSDEELVLVINFYNADNINCFIPTTDLFSTFYR